MGNNKSVLVPADLYVERDDPKHDGIMVLAAWLLDRTAAIDVFRDGAYIPMSRNRLVKLLGSRYLKIVAAAESNTLCLIERNHSYRADSFAKSVRLAEAFRDGRTRSVVLKHARHKKTMQLPQDPVGQWLYGNLSSFTVDDAVESTDNWTRYAVDSIRREHWSFFRDEFGHRLHTNFSRASLAIRGMVLATHNGTPVVDSDLVEIDIRNCQPLVIGHLASLWWLSKKCTVPLDVLCWLDACQSGYLYEDLADKANRAANSNDYDRDWVKQQMMTAHYAEQRVVDSCPLAQLERRYYPSICEFLGWLRTQPIEGEPQTLWFRSTSMLAQRTESKLVIDIACDFLMRSQPTACVLTIHDAMIVAKKHIDDARDAICEAFQTIGLSPALKMQKLSDIQPKPILSPEQRATRNLRLARKRARYARERGNMALLPGEA